jgi:hypothetical protein
LLIFFIIQAYQLMIPHGKKENANPIYIYIPE